MMHRFLLGVVMIFAVGCESAEDEVEVCEALCDELVMECGYTAYPTRESCEQGCLYDQEQGADVANAFRCVREAACDTFAVIECMHVSE